MPTPSPRLQRDVAPVIVAAVLLVIGLYIISSESAATGFGAGADANPALFRWVAGLRTAWLAVAILVVQRLAGRTALGWLLIAMALNPIADLVAAAVAGGGRLALVHLPGTAVTLGVGTWLLYGSERRTVDPQN